MEEVVGIRALSPAPRGLIELVGKVAHGKRNRDVLGVEEIRLALPIETSSRNPGVRQPVERDVVEESAPGTRALQIPLNDQFAETRLPGAVGVGQHERL